MYSLFVMAVAFVRWLVREGCQKFGWSGATWAGSEKSTGEEREPRPEEMAVFGRRLPVGGLWREGSLWWVVFWPPSCGGGGRLDLRLSWRLLGGLGWGSWALIALLAPPSWVEWMNEESWMRGQQTYPHTIHFNMWTVSPDVSIQRRHWQPLSVHLWAYCTHHKLMMWMMWCV